MDYKLIAVDMDDTLLNSEKKVSDYNIKVINTAIEKGYYFVFSTGRSIAELQEFFGLFPNMQYAICESGACIYDVQAKKSIYNIYFEDNLAREILDYAESFDVMPQVLLNGDTILARKDVDNLEHFKMSQYTEHFNKNCISVENVYDYFRNSKYKAEKICLYHTSAESRATTNEKFKYLPVELVNAEETSLEISPADVSKGNGLKKLCEFLDLDLSETIAVGDSYNDISILEMAGLSVAVGNARNVVKNMCDAVVKDCNHSGVADAIEKFLLGSVILQ